MSWLCSQVFNLLFLLNNGFECFLNLLEYISRDFLFFCVKLFAKSEFLYVRESAVYMYILQALTHIHTISTSFHCMSPPTKLPNILSCYKFREEMKQRSHEIYSNNRKSKQIIIKEVYSHIFVRACVGTAAKRVVKRA